MRNIVLSAIAGLGMLVAPSVVPLPTIGPGGLTIRTDVAMAACDNVCRQKCSDAMSRGSYPSMDACIAVWSPRNAEANRKASSVPPGKKGPGYGIPGKGCGPANPEFGSRAQCMAYNRKIGNMNAGDYCNRQCPR